MHIWLPHTRRHIIPQLDHGERPRTVGVVIHSTEGDSLPTAWFARSGGDGVGAHAAFSDHAAVQYLGMERKAWHAGDANGAWIGFEHVGHAHWTRHQWLEHSTMLHLSANRVAWLCHEFHLGRPRKGRNIRSHASGGEAWGGHVDPGPNFPWDAYMKMCTDAYMGHWGRG